MKRARPAVPDPVIALLTELASRPAMNGGFAKLAAQQDDQCTRLEKVETTIDTWDKRFRGLVWVGRAIALAVLGHLAVVGIDHIRLVLH